LGYGAELLSNPSFDDLSGWTAEGSWDLDGDGDVRLPASQDSTYGLQQNVGVTLYETVN
jgi:hypothetical protein